LFPAIADPTTREIARHDVMPVDVIGGLERQEGSHAQDEGAEHVVADVEVIVRVAGPLTRHDSVVGIVGRVLRQPDAELRPLFEALEDKVDAIFPLALESLSVGADVVLLLQLLRLEYLGIGPLDGNVVVAGVGLDPLLVLLRPFGQRLLGQGIDVVYVAEEVHQVLRSCQQREVPLDDDAIETVVYKQEQAAKQLVEGFHRSSPVMRASAIPSCARRLVETRLFAHRCPTTGHTLGSPPISITKGSALEISRPAIRSVVRVPRDFKGGALGYN